jgi:hypothetical protein
VSQRKTPIAEIIHAIPSLHALMAIFTFCQTIE